MIVFIVDDERVIASTLALILREQRFDTRVFFDGQSALLAATTCRPDLLLTDVAMPLMDGPTLARSLLSLHAQCGILFFSGHATEDPFIFDHPANSWRLLAKPIHPTLLIDEIVALYCSMHAGLARDIATYRHN